MSNVPDAMVAEEKYAQIAMEEAVNVALLAMEQDERSVLLVAAEAVSFAVCARGQVLEWMADSVFTAEEEVSKDVLPVVDVALIIVLCAKVEAVSLSLI